MHRILAPSLSSDAAGALVEIDGDEARHAARVKRLEPGEPVELLSGAGLVGIGRHLEAVKLGKTRSNAPGWAIRIRVERVEDRPPPVPALHVRAPAPKGPRLEGLIEQLSQIGAAAWGGLSTKRSVVDPRQGKLDRLERTCQESVKQSGRAWAMSIGRTVPLAAALDEAGPAVVADASGEPYQPTGDARLTLLVGPEGGWTDAELDRCRQAGARVCSFGRHVMRIETAAVAAAAIILNAERSRGPS
ncbi:MAG: RsmE family RNA methyltransferase [Planctomycetota bacterium]